MVKDRCNHCEGISPESCTAGEPSSSSTLSPSSASSTYSSSSSLPVRLGYRRPITAAEQLRTGQRQRSRAARTSLDPNWGPVLQNHSNFLEMHVR